MPLFAYQPGDIKVLLVNQGSTLKDQERLRSDLMLCEMSSVWEQSSCQRRTSDLRLAKLEMHDCRKHLEEGRSVMMCLYSNPSEPLYTASLRKRQDFVGVSVNNSPFGCIFVSKQPATTTGTLWLSALSIWPLARQGVEGRSATHRSSLFSSPLLGLVQWIFKDL